MTTTSVDAAAPPTEEATPAGQALTPPPKLRRRPLLIVAAVAAICLGALLSVWAYTATSSTQEVVAVRQTVERGQEIAREDLMTVQVSTDPALQPLAAGQLEDLVGQRAALDMPAGGVVTQDQVTDSPVPAPGNSVVGLNLKPGMLPAGQLQVGDPVRIVTTPGEQGEPADTDPASVDATVASVTQNETTGTTVVNVEVPSADAPQVAARASTGNVAVILDSQTTGGE